MLEWLADFRTEDVTCGCEIDDRGSALLVEADNCHIGDLREAPACRERVIGALPGRSVERVVHRCRGTERRLVDRGFRVLRRAAWFAERVGVHDATLADRARRDPIGAANAAADRGGEIPALLEASGLPAALPADPAYDRLLAGCVGPVDATVRVNPMPPPGGHLDASDSLPTGATVRRYCVEGASLPVYHLRPVELQLSAEERSILARALDRYAVGAPTGRTPRRAIRAVTSADAKFDVTALASVLRKQTAGFGILEDLFTDPALTDVFVGAPASRTPIRVKRGDQTHRTNLVVTPVGARTLASKLRRASEQPFSAATPTVDATAELSSSERAVRAAGLRSPASDGHGFAFRAHETRPFTLPRLVATGALSETVAAVLSLAVEASASVLVAGARGAGKTTLVGALLWELPPATRLITIEDTPELPVEALADCDRDVQPIRTDRGDGAGIAPAEGLRTALRFGDSALVVGEVRGEEAPVLFEAMRVGAGGSVVLGTVHGDGARDVRDRVVADLGVEDRAFHATDLVVTLGRSAAGGSRHVGSLEEVRTRGDDLVTRDLLAAPGEGLGPPIPRGNSELADSMAAPNETYTEVVDRLETRADELAMLAADGTTAPQGVTSAYARHRTDGDAP